MRDRARTLEDMAGGTFTITNGGVFGSMMGTAGLSAVRIAAETRRTVHVCHSVGLAGTVDRSIL